VPRRMVCLLYTPHSTLKAYRGSRSAASLILQLSTRLEWSTPVPGSLAPEKKELVVQSGPRSQCGRLGVAENLLRLTVIKPMA